MSYILVCVKTLYNTLEQLSAKKDSDFLMSSDLDPGSRSLKI